MTAQSSHGNSIEADMISLTDMVRKIITQNNSVLEVNIEARAGGVEALHLSATYDDKRAEATIPLKSAKAQPRDDHFIRGELFRLGEVLQAIAKSHGE